MFRLSSEVSQELWERSMPEEEERFTLAPLSERKQQQRRERCRKRERETEENHVYTRITVQLVYHTKQNDTTSERKD